MFIQTMRDRMITSLSGSPDVLEALLNPLDRDSPNWDFTPDPERFTLREIIAHLAEYDTIWLSRFQLTLNETNPLLMMQNPSVLAVEHNYAQSDYVQNISLYRERRQAILTYLTKVQTPEWQRTAQLGDRGSMTLEEQVALVVIHDSYHMAQIAQWLAIIQ